MRDRHGNVIVVDAPNASQTRAAAINDGGDVTGTFYDTAANKNRAFVRFRKLGFAHGNPERSLPGNSARAAGLPAPGNRLILEQEVEICLSSMNAGKENVVSEHRTRRSIFQMAGMAASAILGSRRGSAQTQPDLTKLQPNLQGEGAAAASHDHSLSGFFPRSGDACHRWTGPRRRPQEKRLRSTGGD